MESIIDKPRSLTVENRSRIIYDLCRGLKQLNNIGIIYADIKLGNIGWSSRDNCWKIYDFDMAGLFQDGAFVIKPDLDDMGYPDDILKGNTILEIQENLNNLMLTPVKLKLILNLYYDGNVKINVKFFRSIYGIFFTRIIY